MVVNVFGTPITTQTLKDMKEYEGKEIRRIDRAHVALDRKDYEGKYAEVQQYVRELKKEYGDGVSNLCMIYNATGDPITFAYEHDWHGYIWGTPYPAEIANGQWGGFLHVKPPWLATGSFGAIVYRGLNDVETADVYCDWLAAWANPWKGPNKAFTEIRQKGHYDPKDIWDEVYEWLEKSNLTCENTWNGCKSIVMTKQETSPEYEATFTLINAENPPEP